MQFLNIFKWNFEAYVFYQRSLSLRESILSRPGEAVFVVGSHEALGAWSTAMALPLTTSADTFPTWQSKAWVS